MTTNILENKSIPASVFIAIAMIFGMCKFYPNISVFYTQTQLFELEIKNKIISLFSWINMIIVIFILRFIVKKIKKIAQNRRDKRHRLEMEEYHLTYLKDRIIENYKKYSNHELSSGEFIETLKKLYQETRTYEELNEESEKLKKEIKIQEYNLIEWNHRRAISEIDRQIEERKKEFFIIEDKKNIIHRELETDKEKILENLNSYSNRVFLRDQLSKKEEDTLLESQYKFVNEYSIIERKRITVLIKPFGNHSPSHEFLVWDMKRLLGNIKGVRNVMEHLTKDADITFIYNNRTYAIEIETGKLLGKHDQLKEKINYLNRKYPKRWMFIVSHRDLGVKYRKFGRTTARNKVQENLSKLLKIPHTKISYVC